MKAYILLDIDCSVKMERLYLLWFEYQKIIKIGISRKARKVWRIEISTLLLFLKCKKHHWRLRSHECPTTSRHLFCAYDISKCLQILSGKVKDRVILLSVLKYDYRWTLNYLQFWIDFLYCWKILRAPMILLAYDSVFQFLPESKTNSIQLFIYLY